MYRCLLKNASCRRFFSGKILQDPFIVHGNAQWSLDLCAEARKEPTVDRTELKRIAQMSCLDIKEDEMESMLNGLASTVAWSGQLKDVDADNIEPMYSVLEDDGMILRKDIVTEGGNAAIVTKNSKNSHMNFFVVPKVVDFDDS